MSLACRVFALLCKSYHVAPAEHVRCAGEMRFLPDPPEIEQDSPFEDVDDRERWATKGDLGGLPHGLGTTSRFAPNANADW